MITIVEPGWSWVEEPDLCRITQRIEKCGRTCYKSEDRITDDSAEKFVGMICRNNHVSVLEHESLSVRIVCSRACSHQIVRHRLAAYSQESQRYCNYGKLGFQVIAPPQLWLPVGQYAKDTSLEWRRPDVMGSLSLSTAAKIWLLSVDTACQSYRDLMATGLKPEDARFVLPNACKTELIMTMNLRMWRHVFQERALNPRAQWEVRGIFSSIYDEFSRAMPAIFGDLE